MAAALASPVHPNASNDAVSTGDGRATAKRLTAAANRLAKRLWNKKSPCFFESAMLAYSSHASGISQRADDVR